MGTKLVRSPAGLLAGDTLIRTIAGPRSISGQVGKVRLLVPGQGPGSLGVWKEATIRSHGIQKLLNVVMRRGKRSRTERAMPEHHWTLWDRVQGHAIKTTTEELLPGDQLPTCYTGEDFPDDPDEQGWWEVVEVRSFRTKAEVFSVSIPKLGCFTLASGVLTGYCD